MLLSSILTIAMTLFPTAFAGVVAPANLIALNAGFLPQDHGDCEYSGVEPGIIATGVCTSDDGVGTCTVRRNDGQVLTQQCDVQWKFGFPREDGIGHICYGNGKDSQFACKQNGHSCQLQLRSNGQGSSLPSYVAHCNQ